jgi:hypothetical protein
VIENIIDDDLESDCIERLPGFLINRAPLLTAILSAARIRTFDFLSAQGTATFPAGSVGNERPMEASLETWYSPELHIFLYRKRIDPRFGEILYQLTNIQRIEPDPSLFRIPWGYKYSNQRDFVPSISEH